MATKTRQGKVLTQTMAKAIKAGDKPLSHNGVKGILLVPSKTQDGRGRWVLRYVSPTTKKRRDMGLGSFPEISVAQIVKKASEVRSKIHSDLDPINEKQRERNKLITFKNFSENLYEEIKERKWKTEKTRKQWWRRLEIHIFENKKCNIGNMSFKEISKFDIIKILKPIWLTKPTEADKLKIALNLIFEHAIFEEITEINPVRLFDPEKHLGVQKKGENFPAMPWQDLPAFVRDMNLNFSHGRLLLFVILTASRKIESRDAPPKEFNLKTKTWTIPAERMKKDREHQIPLSKQALEILKYQLKAIEKEDELIFTSEVNGIKISDDLLSIQLEGTRSDYENRRATTHGMRTAFRSWAAAQRIDRELAELCLAHKIGDETEQAYNREILLEHRREIMQAWADYVCSEIDLTTIIKNIP